MQSDGPTPTTAGASVPPAVECQHERFKAGVHIHRDPAKVWPFDIQFRAEVRIKCEQCGKDFLFSQLSPTVDGLRDGCSPDGLIALLNIKPSS